MGNIGAFKTIANARARPAFWWSNPKRCALCVSTKRGQTPRLQPEGCSQPAIQLIATCAHIHSLRTLFRCQSRQFDCGGGLSGFKGGCISALRQQDCFLAKVPDQCKFKSRQRNCVSARHWHEEAALRGAGMAHTHCKPGSMLDSTSQVSPPAFNRSRPKPYGALATACFALPPGQSHGKWRHQRIWPGAFASWQATVFAMLQRATCA